MKERKIAMYGKNLYVVEGNVNGEHFMNVLTRMTEQGYTLEKAVHLTGTIYHCVFERFEAI